MRAGISKTTGYPPPRFLERLFYPLADLASVRRIAEYSAAAIPALRKPVRFRRVVQFAFRRLVGRRRIKNEAEFLVQRVEEVLRRTPAHIFRG